MLREMWDGEFKRAHRMRLIVLKMNVLKAQAKGTQVRHGEVSQSLVLESQHRVKFVFADTMHTANYCSYRRSMVRFLLLFFTSDFTTGKFGRSKSLLKVLIVIRG